MIEIAEPPDIAACASCGSVLIWLTMHVHTCRHAQEPTTWRQLSLVPAPDQAERNAAGRAQAEEAIKKPSRIEIEGEEG